MTNQLYFYLSIFSIDSKKSLNILSSFYAGLQIIVASQLTEEQNLWLKNLTDHIDEIASAEKLISEYEKHKNSNLHKAVMDIIVRANSETFREVKEMCEALKELMKDELDAAREDGMRQGISRGIREGMHAGVAKGRAESVIELLQDLGEVPEVLKNKILEEKNLELLRKWTKLAAKTGSLEEFQTSISK